MIVPLTRVFGARISRCYGNNIDRISFGLLVGTWRLAGAGAVLVSPGVFEVMGVHGFQLLTRSRF